MTAAEPSTGYALEDGPLRPGVRAGSYLIQRRLGSGGMGAVYAATHIGLDKPVALKALHRSFAVQEKSVKRFVREGRAASRIRHPHVVDVTDVGSHDGIPFLVMEMLDGEDLEQLLDRCGSLQASRLAEIMLPVVDAVATAHDAGVIHRDLKPSNIFLASDGRGNEVPKVLDFGIARMLHEQGDDRIRLTQQGAFVGTPYYASPEQATNGSAADARSDQYSIGAILYQLASGELPVKGKTPFEVLTAIVCGEVTPFHTLRDTWHPDLVRVVERAMRFDAKERYADLRELGRDMLTLADDETHARFRGVFGAPPRSAAALDVGLLPTRPAMAALHPTAEPVLPETRAAMPRVEGPSFPRPVTYVAETPKRKKSRAPWLLAGAAVLLLGAGAAGAYWVATHPAAPPVEADPEEVDPVEPTAAGPETEPVEAEGAEDTEPPTVPMDPPTTETFTLHVTPDTASIELDGEPVSGTSATIPRDGETHRLRVSAPGFVTVEREFEAGDAVPESLTLVAAAPEPTEPEPEAARGSRPGGRRRLPVRPRRPQNPIRPANPPRQHTAPRLPIRRPVAPPVGANGSPVLR